MKRIKLARKLTLNKTTVSELNNQEQIVGGKIITGTGCPESTVIWCVSRHYNDCEQSRDCKTKVKESYCICHG